MDGRTVVITGATAGIGRATALEIARRGAAVVTIARNPTKAASLADDLAAAAPDAPRLRAFIADLSSLSDVRRVAGEVANQVERIDVLVNNAGIAARRSRMTDEGFDEMLAANYLGPFLLTHLLTDKLRSCAPSRIVIVGSEAHRMAGAFYPETFDHLGSYSGWSAQVAYGRTKLLDILWADELARQLDGSGVTVNSLCPGLVATDLVREVGRADTPGKILSVTPLVRTPAQGARMSVRLATDPAVEGVTGRFFSSTPGLPMLPTVRARRDPSIARLVNERTREIVGVV